MVPSWRIHIAILDYLRSVRDGETDNDSDPPGEYAGRLKNKLAGLAATLSGRKFRSELDYLEEKGQLKLSAPKGAGIDPLECFCEIKAAGVDTAGRWQNTSGRAYRVLETVFRGSVGEIDGVRSHQGKVFGSPELFALIESEGHRDYVRLLEYLEGSYLAQVSWANGRVPLSIEVTSIGIDTLESLDLFRGPGSKSVQQSTVEVNNVSNSTADPSVVFVVHGRNETARKRLFEFLRAVNLRPREFQECIARTQSGSPSITQILDLAFSEAQAIVVLLTPDEEARLRPELGGGAAEFQPRPNVFFEAGMAWQRDPKRTIFVQVGRVREFSDVAGIHTVRMGGGSDTAALHDLCNRLKGAGCSVNQDGADWLSFSFADAVPPFPESRTGAVT